MSTNVVVPATLRSAGRELRLAFAIQLDQLQKVDFIRVWCAIAYIFPGLHPDGFEDAGSGWPRVLKRFAAEAWHRAEGGELVDEELYPCAAQWAGLYDRMHTHKNEEIARRLQIAADYGECADG